MTVSAYSVQESINTNAYPPSSFSLLSDFTNIITSFITEYGFIGLFVAALLENIIFIIPSELIFPLGGFSANTAGVGLIGAFGMAVSGAFGSTVGALVIYYIAMRFGRPAILKMGKYMGIREREVEKAEKWFRKHDSKAVFLGRMAPGIRELISVPAGIERMNISKFIAFTFAGSLIWSITLTMLGYYLGSAWKIVYEDYSIVISIAAAALILGVVVLFVIKYIEEKNILKKR